MGEGKTPDGYPARPRRPGVSSPRARARVTQPCAVERAPPRQDHPERAVHLRRRPGFLHQPHPVRTMKKIPELSIAQRSISLSEIPPPERVAAALTGLRERRSDIADVFEFMSLTGVRWGEVRAIRVSWLGEIPLPQLNVERSHSGGYDEKDPKILARHQVDPAVPSGSGDLPQACAREAPGRLPLHQPLWRPAYGRRGPQVPARVPPPRATALRRAEGVVRKSGHSTDTRPEIQPRSQPKKNRNSPGMGL